MIANIRQMLDVTSRQAEEKLLENLKAFAKDPATVDKAIFALVHQIDEHLKTRRVLTMKQSTVVRQMGENAAMLMIAAAESTLPNNREVFRANVSKADAGVSSLLESTTENGANVNKIRQLQKMADEIMRECAS
jgi:hypothetical protein